MSALLLDVHTERVCKPGQGTPAKKSKALLSLPLIPRNFYHDTIPSRDSTFACDNAQCSEANMAPIVVPTQEELDRRKVSPISFNLRPQFKEKATRFADRPRHRS